MTPAADMLAEAALIVEGARQRHGGSERSFGFIAALWSAYTGHPITPRDVAVMMVLLKIGRAQSGAPIRDHFVDMAGYAALAGELAQEEGAPCE